MGIKRYYLSFLENKKFLPDTELAEKISKELKASMGQLWTDEELISWNRRAKAMWKK